MVNIFISYRKCVDYKLALKLKHDEIITISRNLFEQSNLINIQY